MRIKKEFSRFSWTVSLIHSNLALTHTGLVGIKQTVFAVDYSQTIPYASHFDYNILLLLSGQGRPAYSQGFLILPGVHYTVFS